MGRLDGKVVFITGAARGQGRYHAVRLAQEGADVAISDVCAPVEGNLVAPATPEDLKETTRLVEKTGRQVIARHVDVRDLGRVADVRSRHHERARSTRRRRRQRRHPGVGNAWELTTAQWQAVIDVNLTGVFHTVRATVPHLIRQNQGGWIILVSSSAGLKGQPFTLHYTAAKHGVVGICRGLANGSAATTSA